MTCAARDHRQLGMGIRNLDEYLASSSEFFGRVEIFAPVIIEWQPPVLFSSGSARIADTDYWISEADLMISTSRDGRIARQDCFDPGDIDGARARFDQLVAEYARSAGWPAGRN